MQRLMELSFIISLIIKGRIHIALVKAKKGGVLDFHKEVFRASGEEGGEIISPTSLKSKALAYINEHIVREPINQSFSIIIQELQKGISRASIYLELASKDALRMKGLVFIPLNNLIKEPCSSSVRHFVAQYIKQKL